MNKKSLANCDYKHNVSEKATKLVFFNSKSKHCFLIKNYAETTLLIGEKNISPEASYTPQQSSRRLNLQKLVWKKNIFAW